MTLFWSCPRVAQFWMEVFEVINFCLQLTLPISPTLVLGISDDEQRPRYTKLLISYLLYYATREIILKRE